MNVNPPIIASTNGHDWAEYQFKSGNKYTCCIKCGIIRRRDDQNSQCRGKVKVALR